jgi:hypothetical protein
VIDDKNQAIQLVQKQELYEFGIPKMCVHSMLIRKPYIPHHLEQESCENDVTQGTSL